MKHNLTFNKFKNNICFNIFLKNLKIILFNLSRANKVME